MDICEAAISVEWMLQVMRAMVFPSETRRSSSSGVTPTELQILICVFRISSRFERFSAEVTTALMKGFPSVVSPRTFTLTLSEASETFWKYSTIRGQSATFLSVPGLNPRKSSGEMIFDMTFPLTTFK